MVRSLCIASMLILLLIVGCRSEPPADVGYLVLSGANFDEIVLSSDQPVLVDFFATWCPPCKAMAPIVAEVAAEFEGRAVVGQLDIDQNPALAAQYEVEYLPTFILFARSGDDPVIIAKANVGRDFIVPDTVHTWGTTASDLARYKRAPRSQSR